MDSWPLGNGLLRCPVTLVRNYHYSLRINPEERSSHLFRSGSLKSRKCLHVSGVFMEVWSASRCPCYVCIEVIEVLVMRVYAFSIPGIPLSLSLSLSVSLCLICFLALCVWRQKTVFKSLVCVTFIYFVAVANYLHEVWRRRNSVFDKERTNEATMYLSDFCCFQLTQNSASLLDGLANCYKTVAEPCCT